MKYNKYEQTKPNLFITNNPPDLQCIECTPSKECDEYHKGMVIQITVTKDMDIIKAKVIE